MRYVDAGYAIALATLFVYAVTLILRRRRWERALKLSERGSSLKARRPRRGVVTDTTTEPTPPPSPPASEVHQGPATPPPPPSPPGQLEGPGRLRAPAVASSSCSLRLG